MPSAKAHGATKFESGVDFMRIRFPSLGALALLASWVAGCGGNATPVGITVIPTGTTQAPVPVIANGTQPFSASVSGTSTAGVTWQVCLPGATTLTLPTTCSPPSTSQTALSGFGTIVSTGTSTALYTAPPKPPTPNNFVVVATSVANTLVFSSSNVAIVSGITVVVNPITPVTMGPGETFQFSTTITGTSNQAVTWSVASGTSGDIPGGNPQIGTITPNGLFTAPLAAETATITATSAADPTVSGSQTVTVSGSATPTVTFIDPTSAAAGSAQQDVFITGTNFLTTTVAVVSTSATGANATVLPPTLISPTLIRVTIPGTLLQGPPGAAPGSVFIQLTSQNGADVSTTLPLQLLPTRPAIVASTPDSVAETPATVSVNLTGGFFTSAVSAFFGGLTGPFQVFPAIANSRQMTVTVPNQSSPVNLSQPGLYPLILQNSNIPAPAASMSAVNLAVVPPVAQGAGVPQIPNAPLATFDVGNSPSAVAIDAALGLAVVANTGDNSVSIVNLSTNAVTPISNVGHSGNQPTGVAVDDLLPHHLALVVNSTDNALAVIDLSLASPAVIGTVSLAGFTPPGTSPVSIGINPLSHRALVANSTTTVGTIIDLANANPQANPPCNTPPCPLTTVQAIGGITYFTGPKAFVGIDPRLNFAVATPGGSGNVNFVDLGRAPSPGDGGRPPMAFGTFGTTQTVQGIGINSETHLAFLADPNGSNQPAGTVGASGLETFSFLNDVVTSVSQQAGYVAAAVDSLTNVGIAVSADGDFATILDLSNGLTLQTVNLPAGSAAQAVAVDQAGGEAIVADTGTGKVSILSLGGVRTPQIVESSPSLVFAPTQTPVTLQIVGSGFVAGSQVLLDGVPLAGATIVSPREITATVPVNMLGNARRYIVAVQVPGGALSNVTDLTVIQQVLVGSTPFGVAVDTDRDLAIVTNSGEGTASIVDLTGATTGTAGSLTGPNITVGTTPQGVASIPRLGVAVVANNGSNNLTTIDVTRMNPQITTPACPSGTCTGPVGVAANSDDGNVLVTNGNATISPAQGNVELFTIIPSTTGGPVTVSGPTITVVETQPLGVAVDATLDVGAVSVEQVQLSTTQTTGGLQTFTPGTLTTLGIVDPLSVPTGVIFDPLNQVFVGAVSSQNDLIFAVPSMDVGTPIAGLVGVAIAPTSLDYNFQTSTLVTVNSASNTISIIDYVCPAPPVGPATCPVPEARQILGLVTVQDRSLLLPFAVAIDPKLNLAVIVDHDNNRVLLFPLPN
jgi:DNA-binding beta-propeller fold protein YncE